MGSLKATSIILGLKTIEKRLRASIHHIHVDKGSSLTPALLENKNRSWKVIQAPATHHSSLLVEGRIKLVRRFFNTFHGKFSKEVKTATPLHIFQFLMLTANLEYQINSIPFSRHNQLSPSHIINARGIEQERTHWELIESGEGTKGLSSLEPYLRSLEKFRNELMAEALSSSTSLHDVNEDKLYLPKSGSVVLALMGSGNTAELAVVTKGTDETVNSEPNSDPVAQNEDVSERKVMVKNKNGHERLYPVAQLCPLADPTDPLEWRPDSASNISNLSGIKAVLFDEIVLNLTIFSWKTPEKMMMNNWISLKYFHEFFCKNKRNIGNFQGLTLSTQCMDISAYSSHACAVSLCPIIIFRKPGPHSLSNRPAETTVQIIIRSVHIVYIILSTIMRFDKWAMIMILFGMVNWSHAKPVAAADPEAKAMPFFFDVSLSVRDHPEEALSKAHHVSHAHYVVIFVFNLYFLYMKVKFDSDTYHTDGNAGDYVYQSVSNYSVIINSLVHVFLSRSNASGLTQCSRRVSRTSRTIFRGRPPPTTGSLGSSSCPSSGQWWGGRPTTSGAWPAASRPRPRGVMEQSEWR